MFGIAYDCFDHRDKHADDAVYRADQPHGNTTTKRMNPHIELKTIAFFTVNQGDT